jgi:hypothetical protein
MGKEFAKAGEKKGVNAKKPALEAGFGKLLLVD